MRKPFVYKSLNGYSKCLLKNFSLRFLCTVGRLPLFKRRTISCFTFVVVSFSGYKCLSVLFISTGTFTRSIAIRYYLRFALVVIGSSRKECVLCIITNTTFFLLVICRRCLRLTFIVICLT